MRGLPTIGITLGDPAGIGPEIIVKALSQKTIWTRCKPVVLGDVAILKRATKIAGVPVRVKAIRSPQEVSTYGDIPVIQSTGEDLSQIRWGVLQEGAAKAQVDFLKAAVELAISREIHAIVTAPITKAGLKLAGEHYPGHTEILATWTGARRYAMMLAGRRLKVVPVTIHCALKEVAERLNLEGIVGAGLLTHRALLEWFRISNPVIAVAGLNPHCGEGGMFGDEEERVIRPAVEHLRDMGVDARGPLVPDVVYRRAAEGEFDAVLSMYHDQGLIPLKLLEKDKAVNLTLGLPMIRTSPDHGTAYDIAGKGIASCESLVQAISLASRIYRNRLSSAKRERG